MLTPVQCARAASAYRALIRAQKFTFAGDDFALRSAHHQTRSIFSQLSSKASQSANESTLPMLSGEAADDHIRSAFEIASYLRKNVVQGIKTEEEGVYALRFTEETERGDNDSIKQPPESEAREMRPPRQGNEGVKRRRRVVTAASADV